jgi:hypothetical protein
MTGYFLYFNFSEKRSMIIGVMIPEKTGERKTRNAGMPG